ncbi:MAG: hypothetical protein Q8904_08865 [Bacteroidota bacterium]|nr:hypothetical protein [Bacteroidota bacterium]
MGYPEPLFGRFFNGLVDNGNLFQSRGDMKLVGGGKLKFGLECPDGYGKR